MKVVFRISRLGFGGAEQVFLSVAKVLKKTYGCEVIFVIDNLNGQNVITATNLGFEVVNLAVSRTLFSVFKLAKYIRKTKPDLIISAYTDTNAACVLSQLISFSNTKVIVSEHASLTEHWQGKSKLKKRLLNFYVSYIYRYADHVICVSQGLSKQVGDLLGHNRNITTIYNPVRFNKSEPQIQKDARPLINLLAVGRITAQKDYKTLVNALFYLRKTHEAKLAIVGGVFCNAEYEKVYALAEKLKVAEHITFVGYSDCVEDYYKAADIFVLSSAWEGFGNVIVEAMSFGLPVVATNCNYGPGEILEGGVYGRLVDVGDYQGFANAIAAEINSPLVTPEQLIKRSQNFSESNIASEYHQLISEVMHG